MSVGNRHILVVENDLAIQNMLAILLEAENYDVRSAANGAEALDLDPTWRPDVILLDLMMPVMDGREFLARREAVAHLATAPVIILTAEPGVASLRASSGVRAVVTKPHDVQPLLDLIEQTLHEPVLCS
jgi:CheY-like chemotaxis protein